MLLLKSCFILIVVTIQITASDKSWRDYDQKVEGTDYLVICPQCVSGNFLSKQWLFQNWEMDQSMGWVHQWEGTDCSKMKYTMIKCWSSCINIITYKDTHLQNNYEFDGLMMDCSDMLIESTPDLPRDFDPNNFHGSATFSNIRANHNITYIFHNNQYKENDNIMSHLPKQLSQEKQQKNIPIFYVGIVFGLAILASCSIFICTRCIVRCYRKVRDNKKNSSIDEILSTFTLPGTVSQMSEEDGITTKDIPISSSSLI